MQFHQPKAQIYIPDENAVEDALSRTAHLAIGAHQDDLEIMAIDGILSCFQDQAHWFSGVVVSDRRSSARSVPYRDFSDEQMRQVRNNEQKKAAVIGEYSAQVFLEYPSSQVKDPDEHDLVQDLAGLITATTPQIIYSHNPADKHDTHIGVLCKVLEAIWQLPAQLHPQHLYGCEVWRDLDWLLDEDKVVFDATQNKHLQAALVEVFDSQIRGGKRYDLATMGRRRANATYYASHEVDAMSAAAFAMDLTPLMARPGSDIAAFVEEKIAQFSQDVRQRFDRMGRS